MSGLLADDDAGIVANLVAVATEPELLARLQAGAVDHAAQFSWASTSTRVLRTVVDEVHRHRAKWPLLPRRR